MRKQLNEQNAGKVAAPFDAKTRQSLFERVELAFLHASPNMHVVEDNKFRSKV